MKFLATIQRGILDCGRRRSQCPMTVEAEVLSVFIGIRQLVGHSSVGSYQT